jgi:hypothetical protein
MRLHLRLRRRPQPRRPRRCPDVVVATRLQRRQSLQQLRLPPQLPTHTAPATLPTPPLALPPPSPHRRRRPSSIRVVPPTAPHRCRGRPALRRQLPRQRPPAHAQPRPPWQEVAQWMSSLEAAPANRRWAPLQPQRRLRRGTGTRRQLRPAAAGKAALRMRAAASSQMCSGCSRVGGNRRAVLHECRRTAATLAWLSLLRLSMVNLNG